jgi:hypothetical protein
LQASRCGALFIRDTSGESAKMPFVDNWPDLLRTLWQSSKAAVENPRRIIVKWQDYIEERKDVMLGKPVFRETRLTVEQSCASLARELPETICDENIARDIVTWLHDQGCDVLHASETLAREIDAVLSSHRGQRLRRIGVSGPLELSWRCSAANGQHDHTRTNQTPFRIVVCGPI